MKNCRCFKNLLTFPKDITKLDFIKDWIIWAEPIITDLNTRVPNLEEWKEIANTDIESIKNNLDNLTAIEFNNGSIKAKVETVPNGTTAKISMSVFENGYHNEAQITLANIDNLKRALDNPDSKPTRDSNNLITSKAVYNALQEVETNINTLESDVENKLKSRIVKPDICTQGNIPVWTSNGELIDSTRTVEEHSPSEGSNDLITSGAVYEALQNIPSSPTESIISENGTRLTAVNGALTCLLKEDTTTKAMTINYNNIDNLRNALNSPDTVPTFESSRLITSGGVYNALSQIENTTSIPIVYRILDDNVMSPPTIEIDSLFPVGGSNRVTLIIKNANSSERDVIDLNNRHLYSNSGYPIHMAKPFNNASTSENTIHAEGYMILNLYKIDLATFKDEVGESHGSQVAYHSVDHGSNSELPICYFITLGGVFESVV